MTNPLVITSSGSTDKTRAFLAKMQAGNMFASLEQLAQQGVNALAGATPVETGLTAASWSYEIENTGSSTRISWSNSNRNGVSIVLLIQYGHGTGTGGYVAGRDFINPAIQPIFDQIADDVWKQVTLA